jgi:hypothetical protein
LNNSDDYEILQELDDHGIVVKFFLDLIITLQEILKNISIRKLDKYGILVKLS